MNNSGTLQVTTPTDREVVVTRVVTAPRRLVFEAWTNPEYLPRWMLGPPGWTMPVCEIDLRPGGAFRTVMNGPNGERHDNTGCFLEVVPNERIVFTDALGPGYRPAAAPFMTAVITPSS